MPGLDNTAYAAEVWALLTAARAACHLGRPIHFIIDNLAVVRLAAALAEGTPIGTPPPPLLASWLEIAGLFERCGQPVLVTWIPSHDKLLDEWQAPDPTLTDRFRLLNRLADEAATAALDCDYTTSIATTDEAWKLAARRSRATLRRWHCATNWLRGRFPCRKNLNRPTHVLFPHDWNGGAAMPPSPGASPHPF